MLLACIRQVQEHVHAPNKGVVSFFSGRRAPHPEFHLLQNMYLPRSFRTRAPRVAPRSRLLAPWQVRRFLYRARPSSCGRYLQELWGEKFGSSSLLAGRVLQA